MNNTTKHLILAAVISSGVAQAQQSPSPSTPSQSAAASTAPCAKPTAAPQRKPGWLETKTKKLACAQNKNLCDLPSSASEVIGGTTTAKPCPPNTAASATPASPSKAQTPAVPAATANPATGVTASKPAYVCPPKTTLIPNTPYCLAADRTTVDAIPLPAGMSTPAPTTATTPAPATPKQ